MIKRSWGEKWPNPLMWRNRDGNFPLEWRSHERRKKNFPMNHERHIIYGGAGVVKINFPMSGKAANGEIYFHHDCCAIYYVPWVMNGEIYPSLFFHIKGFTFPYKEWKFHQYKYQNKLYHEDFYCSPLKNEDCMHVLVSHFIC